MSPRSRQRPAAAASEPKKDDGKAKAEAAAAAVEAKREERAKLEAKQTTEVYKRYVNGDESLAVVAKSLSITSGKAAFLVMLKEVADGNVPAITGKDDDTLVKNIAAARAKADEHSSWGWLAARASKSEGWIKTKLEEAKLYSPRAENIASKRAEAKPPKVKKESGENGTKPKGRTRPKRGNAS